MWIRWCHLPASHLSVVPFCAQNRTHFPEQGLEDSPLSSHCPFPSFTPLHLPGPSCPLNAPHLQLPERFGLSSLWPEIPSSKLSKEPFPHFPIKISFCPALSLSHPPFIFPKLLLLSEIILHESLTQLLTICHQNTNPWQRETRLSCSLTSLSCKQKALNNYFLEEWRTAWQNAHLKVRWISQSTRGWVSFLLLLDAAYPSREHFEFKNSAYGEFPGGPVVRTQHFHCRGPGFDPWSGN